MSRYTSLQKSPIYQAIFAIFMGFSASSAYAAIVGQATVQSEQHEPLVATIAVNNIDAKNFSASLAPSAIYQQMGLEQTDVTVQFVATSDTAGRILLTSSQPISTPFTDIVLSLDNNGEQQIEPQTLLMPLPKNDNITESITQTLITADNTQNLPVVSNNIPDEETSYIDAGQEPELASTSPTTQIQDSTPSLSPQVLSSEERVISTLTPEGTNTQLNILTEKITRSILPAGSTPVPPSFDNISETPLMAQPVQNKTDKQQTNGSETQDSGTAVYVVQSGDTLWNIANEIAKANNSDITQVMQSLHEQNPDAFSNNNINKLKANASLRIVNYEVVPSQKAISDAIAAKTGRAKKSQKDNTGSTSIAKAKSTRYTNTTARVAPKPLPKPQVTLATPSKSGSATGGSREQNTTAQSAGGNSNLVANLKSVRANTAQTAKKVNGLNQELSSATQKLQLQNQKLAELEARLKSLKDK